MGQPGEIGTDASFWYGGIGKCAIYSYALPPARIMAHFNAMTGQPVTQIMQNTAEGGTSGTTVTDLNCGGLSGMAFDEVNITTGVSVTFDNAHAAHGKLAYKISSGATSANPYLGWVKQLSGPWDAIWWRTCLYLTANPASQHRIFAPMFNTSNPWSFAISSSGKIVMLNSGGSAVTTSAASIPLNQWFRVEGKIVADPSNGRAEVRLFSAADALAAAETNSVTGQNTGAAVTEVRFGHGVGGGVANLGPFWMDDLAISTLGYPGPPQVPLQPPIAPLYPPVMDPANW
jgi:hypothetical protein